MTLVSVILPVLNGADTIERSMQSVLGQSLKDLELIVVDDGSTDATGKIVSTIAARDARVRSIQLDQNHGVSYARNVGMRAAVGSWIALLDADDWMEPFRLEGMVSAGDEWHADILVDNLKIIDSATGVVEGQSCFGHLRQTVKLEAADLFSKDTPFIHPAIGFAHPLFRTAFLREKKMFYNESYKLGEDFAFLAENVLLGGALYALPFCGYVYQFRTNPLSVDRSDPLVTKRQYADVLSACEYLYERYSPEISFAARQAMTRRQRLFEYVLMARQFKKMGHDGKWGQACLQLIRSPGLAYFLVRIAAWRVARFLMLRYLIATGTRSF